MSLSERRVAVPFSFLGASMRKSDFSLPLLHISRDNDRFQWAVVTVMVASAWLDLLRKRSSTLSRICLGVRGCSWARTGAWLKSTTAMKINKYLVLLNTLEKIFICSLQ